MNQGISIRLAGKDPKIPTPPRAFHYEFRDLPDYPDDAAETNYIQKAWATVDGWNANLAGPLTVSGGKLRATPGQGGTYKVGIPDYQGKTIALRVISVMGGVHRIAYRIGTTWINAATPTLVAQVDTILSVTLPSGSVIDGLVLGGMSIDYAWDWIYIGTGKYATLLHDYSGNNNHGIPYACSPVKSCRDYGYKFNELNSFVKLSGAPITTITGPFVLFFKVKGAVRTGTQYLFTRGWTASPNLSIQAGLYNNYPFFRISLDGTSWTFNIAGAMLCNIDRTIAFEIGGTPGLFVARVWIDGVISASQTSSSYSAFIGTYAVYSAAIGACYASATTLAGYFPGTISDASMIIGNVSQSRIAYEMAQIGKAKSWRLPISRIDEGTSKGNILSTRFEHSRSGGLVSAEFTLADDADIPLTKEMLIEIWVDGIFCEIGYVDENKENGTKDNKIVVSCKGLSERLKRKTISKTFTNMTLVEIILDIAADVEELEIIASPDTLLLPSIFVASMDASDIDLFELIERVLAIANAAYIDEQYHWFIDNCRRLCFEEITSNDECHLYEGFHFQNPDVNNDRDSIINVVRFFRTDSTNKSVSEFVAEYTDVQSILDNGESAEKISYSDYMDDATCARIADGLISRFKDPLVQIDVSDILVEPDGYGQFLPFALYGINLRPRQYWKEITNGETLDGLDLGNVQNVAITLDTAHILMGRNSIKAVMTASPASTGYLEFPLDHVINFPKELRAFVYLTPGASITLTALSSYGDSQERQIINRSTRGEWITFSLEFGNTIGSPYTMYGQSAGGNRAIYGLNAASANVAIFGLRGAALRNLESVRIYFDDISGTAWIDRIDILADEYKRVTLPLDSVKYESKNGSILASASFGEPRSDLVKTIEGVIKDKQSLANIFIKE
jgi:hypothetical protein